MTHTTRTIWLTLLLLSSTTGYAAAEEDCRYVPGPPDAQPAYASEPQDGEIALAWYGQQTTSYQHGVLGDAIEAGRLYVKLQNQSGCGLAFTLPEDSVFEDVTPRIADVTGDGANDVIVIESHQQRGASLAVYGIEDSQLVKLASAPYVGKRFRWLAPVGMADFNNDGIDDVAYVQTPHIGGILKIWSFRDSSPQQLASAGGFSNHRIGENFITGGIRDCGNGVEMVLPDQRWSQVLLVEHRSDGQLNTQVYSPQFSMKAIEDALACL